MAMVLDFVVGRFLGKLADFVEGEISKVLGVEEDIEKLTGRMEIIRPYLQTADQWRYEDAAINAWMTQLKDIMYDVEDIIDDCTIEGGKRLESHLPSSCSSSSSKVVSLPFRLLSCFACTKYRHEIANRIEQVTGRLDAILKENLITSRLAQQSTPSKNKPERSESIQETTSMEYKADIIGTQIEVAAEDLINNHILKNNEENKMCNIIGIVGMGGIGKTTLARKIMNDQRIVHNFSIRSWLHVSKNYSRKELLRDIVKHAGGYTGAEDIQELEVKVSHLKENFFIVLDDVWNTNVWNEILRNPILNAGAERRMILVTSRDESLVSSIKASYIHHVEAMNDDDGWKLLSKIVFEDGDSEIHNIEGIGKQLVQLCGGLPLAIKVTGGVLSSKDKTRKEWENVLKSDIWQMNQMDAKLPNALYLSYEDLSSSVKGCFLSCALYNGICDSRDLVRLWVAEGLIAEKDHNRLEEDVAEGYYKQLVKKNILQLEPSSLDYRYSMHDLLRSLAANLIRGEGKMMDDKSLDTNCSTKIRRLSLSTEGYVLTLPNEIKKGKCLRSLSLYGSGKIKTMEAGLLEGLRNLRILNIRYTQIVSLPDSLFQLIHLRYLNLDDTFIQKIPEAIGRLVNLQTLNMRWCRSLQSLPNSITKLHNLRCLRLYGSCLSHLPKGIGKLTNLNYISGFVIGHPTDVSKGCDLGELQSLPKMRSLKITNLERASSTGTPALADKATCLKVLFLEWTAQEGDDEEATFREQMERAEKICSELKPPSTIEDLRMQDFPGRLFPDWITSSTCLTFLNIDSCYSCTELPPLGRLPQLKHLEITGATQIKTIGTEFLGSSSAAAPVAFPKLESLFFEFMLSLEEWRMCEGMEGRDVKLLFPALQECTFQICPSLRALPENLYCAPKLKKIVVSGHDDYTQTEYRRHRSILRLAYDPFFGPHHWVTEFLKEPKVEPSAPPKILFYLHNS